MNDCGNFCAFTQWITLNNSDTEVKQVHKSYASKRGYNMWVFWTEEDLDRSIKNDHIVIGLIGPICPGTILMLTLADIFHNYVCLFQFWLLNRAYRSY